MTAAVRHLVRLLAVLAVLVAANFLLPRLLPGSPLHAGEDIAFLPRAAVQRLRETYGLDRPLLDQGLGYLRDLARGDLGRSIATARPVAEMIGERLPWTILLVGGAVAISSAIGLATGTVAAWRPAGAAARVLGPLLVGVGALPEVLVAMGLIVGLGVGLRLFPVGGAATPFLAPDGAGGWLAWAADVAWHAALPTATLVAGLLPAVFLLSRDALAAVLGERYLLTARGKGLGPGRLLWHAWRNAGPPVLTLLGLRLAFVVTGAAVVERIFAYPGMGLLLFEAVARRDYPVIQGVFLVASVTTLATIAVFELAAAALDPRTREPSA